MSTKEISSDMRPKHFAPGTGSDRYVRFVQDWLDVQPTEVLETILEAFEEHQKVLVQAANGVGKSFSADNAALAGTFCNANTTCNITSGSYGQLDDTIWKPMKSLHRQSDLPGRTLDNTRELKTGLDEEWYIKCLSPKYPGDLEGRHNDRMLYIIEEADKPGIQAEHIDSALSTLTDEDDRILVICNPPEDESNVVHDLRGSDEWHTINFSSWDSHDCKVDTGEIHGPKIGGLADLSKIKSDWDSYNNEDWPGLEQAKAWSTKSHEEFRTDLDSRWYRRRAGIMPPDSAEKWRPWSIGDVEAAYQRDVGRVRNTPEVLGIDVADKNDTTKAIGLRDQKAVVEYDSQESLPQQQSELLDKIREWPEMQGYTDAIGRGAQLAQALQERFVGFKEFGNNEVPPDDDYRNRWAHGLQLIGEWLRSGGSFEDKKLYEQLKVGARVLQFERNHLSKRGKVIEATKKEKFKRELGYSPDETDALLMAITARETDEPDDKASPTFGW